MTEPPESAAVVPALPAFPITRIAWERTVRLVSSARLRDPVLRKLVGRDFMADLAEIEAATSGRLTIQHHGAADLPVEQLVAGPAHAAFINAAFSYWRPAELNRFNGPGRGAWYAALALETCIAEVAFHLTRELERTNDFNAVVDYAEMFASFAGEFADLRDLRPAPECLSADPVVGYPAGNHLADTVRHRGLNGIVYPSVRHGAGTCLVALWPAAVQSVAQGGIVRLTWSGTPDYEWAALA
ncbi:MAG TPA: RES family NAD+ phosphorylase [Xanthobacteraceae bacterium]